MFGEREREGGVGNDGQREGGKRRVYVKISKTNIKKQKRGKGKKKRGKKEKRHVKLVRLIYTLCVFHISHVRDCSKLTES